MSLNASYPVSSLILLFYRSFPGLFGKTFTERKSAGNKGTNSALNIKSLSSSIKCFPIQFYLVYKYVEKTATNIEGLNLLQAGMGRRTITVMEDADHSWVGFFNTIYI